MREGSGAGVPFDVDASLAQLGRIAADLCGAGRGTVVSVDDLGRGSDDERFGRAVLTAGDMVVTAVGDGFRAGVALPTPWEPAHHVLLLDALPAALAPSTAALVGAAARLAAGTLVLADCLGRLRDGADPADLLAGIALPGLTAWESHMQDGFLHLRADAGMRALLGHAEHGPLHLGPDSTAVPDAELPGYKAAVGRARETGVFHHLGRVLREDGGRRTIECAGVWRDPVLRGATHDVTDRELLAALAAAGGPPAGTDVAAEPSGTRVELDVHGRIVATEVAEQRVGTFFCDTHWWSGSAVARAAVGEVMRRVEGGEAVVLELPVAAPTGRVRMQRAGELRWAPEAVVAVECWPIAAAPAPEPGVAPLGSVELDLLTGVHTWSEQAHRILGYEPGAVEPSFEAVRAVTLPADQARLNGLETPLRSGEPRPVRHRIRRPDDARLRTLELRPQILRDGDGVPRRLSATVRDVTDAVAREAPGSGDGSSPSPPDDVLAVLAAVVEHAPSAIYVCDVDERVVVANRVFHEVLGLAGGSGVGQPLADVLPAELLPRVRRLDAEVLARAAPFEREDVLPGQPATMLIQKFPLAGADGVPYAVCTFMSDLSELRRHERGERRRAILDGALDELLQAGLNRPDVDALCARACTVVAAALGVTDVAIVERAHTWVVARAAVGRAAGRAGHHVELDPEVLSLVTGRGSLAGPAATAQARLDAVVDTAAAGIAIVAVPGEVSTPGALVVGGGGAELGPDDVAFLEQVGRLIGTAIARQHARVLREQLAHGERLEAVGKLAGGIAHDFNNLLSVILNFAGFAAMTLEDDPASARADLEEIVAASRRGADLMQRLLVFSRGDVVAAETLAVNDLIHSALPLLEALAGRRATVRLDLGEVGLVRAAPRQLEDALMALVANACEAATSMATVTIATTMSTMPEGGPAVRLEVRDTGPGMDPGVAARAFDPFFSTRREAGHAGLGLASVFGTVRQLDGTVDIETEPGGGTRVVVCLPASGGDAITSAPEARELAPAIGSVLVVEDEAAVRTIVRRVLERAGYTVYTAADGAAALDLADELPGGVDILLTDVVMPGMSGREVAEVLHGRWPDVIVVYMSGYADSVLVKDGRIVDGTRLLEKPFTPEALLTTLAEAAG